MGNEDLSNAFGWVSIACWIVVYSPQFIENYTLQSGEGVSIAFVFTWLLGDICNLTGALMANLQSTVVIIAVYYTLCDIMLLLQIYYYRYKQRRRVRVAVPVPVVSVVNEAGEQTPLLHSPTTAEEDHKAGSRSRSSSSSTGTFKREMLRHLLSLAFVVSAGIAAWTITRQVHGTDGGGADPDTGSGTGKGPKAVVEWKSQVIGWTSATLYLGSRIPQILKNIETHCEGLSLALFMFTVAGNVTYVLSICTLSMEREHLIANASWLAGSGLTVFFDFIVFGQFFYYRFSGPKPVAIAGEPA